MSLDHSEISELLTAYVGGELDAQRSAAVRAHLEGCRDCRMEWAALRAFRELPEARLEPHERVALRDAVRARSRSQVWSRRLAPVLGTLGLVAIVAVGATAVFLGQGGRGAGDRVTSEGPAQQDSATEDGEVAGRDEASPRRQNAAARAAPRGGAAGTTEDTAAGMTSALEELQGDAAAGNLTTAVTGVFRDAAPLDADLITDTGDRRPSLSPKRRFALFVEAAPTATWARQMRACSDAVASFLPSGAGPAYAAIYEADRLLVMGFVWPEPDGDHYAFWGWPQGDCTTVTPVHSRGTI